FLFFFSSRRRHTRFSRDWSSDVCSSDLFFSLAWWCLSFLLLVSSLLSESSGPPSPPAVLPLEFDLPSFSFSDNSDFFCSLTFEIDRKSTRLYSSHVKTSYAVPCVNKSTA